LSQVIELTDGSEVLVIWVPDIAETTVPVPVETYMLVQLGVMMDPIKDANGTILDIFKLVPSHITILVEEVIVKSVL
jgi:hypothetical protein